MWDAERWILLAWLVSSIPVCLLIGRIIFGGWNGFCNAWSDEPWETSGRLFPSCENQQMGVFVLLVIATLAAEYGILCRFGLL